MAVATVTVQTRSEVIRKSLAMSQKSQKIGRPVRGASAGGETKRPMATLQEMQSSSAQVGICCHGDGSTKLAFMEELQERKS